MEEEIRIVVTINGKPVKEYFTCPQCNRTTAVHFVIKGDWEVVRYVCGFKFRYTRQKSPATRILKHPT